MALGNWFSLFVDLPLADPDPLLRYRKTVAASEALKNGSQAAGAETLIELAGATPPLIHSVVARLAFTPRLFNVTITNVPGPPTTLYAMGAPMRRVLPLVPIFAGYAVGVAVVSDGNVTFRALHAGLRHRRRPRCAQEGIEESLADLGRTAKATNAA
ncbi:MAG: WS/DGAT domain-containing protein [Solirubrobacterales bacterium]